MADFSLRLRLALIALACLTAGAAILSDALAQSARHAPAPLRVDRSLMPDDGWASNGPLWLPPRQYARGPAGNVGPKPSPPQRWSLWFSWSVGVVPQAP